MAKPDPAIYLKTAQALKTEPGRILFIDDREENIAAAAEFGMQAVHYTTQDAFESEMRGRGLAGCWTWDWTARGGGLLQPGAQRGTRARGKVTVPIPE